MANTKLPSRLLDTSAVPALNVTGDLTVDTNTLKVDTTNNRVGIGYTSPQKALHISAGSPVVRLEDSDGGYGEVSGSNGNIRLRADEGNTQATSFISFDIDGDELVRIKHTGYVGIGENDPDNILHIKSTASGGPQIQIGDGTNYAFMNFDGTNLQLSTQRDMVDGTWYNTGKSWGGINIKGKTDGSEITIATAPNANTSPTTRFVLNKNGSLILGSTAATAGHSFEVQDRSDGYSMFWTGRGSSGEGRGITNAYGLLGVNSTQYDGDGAYYPVAGFGAAADNSSNESVDFWFGSTTSEWQPMVFMCIGAHTATGQTGQTAGWALIRATHYNNGISTSILDSGGGGTFSISVIGSYVADRSDTSRCRITYSSNQNRTVLSVWGANYSRFYGAQRA